MNMPVKKSFDDQVEEDRLLTIETFKRCVPPKTKKLVTQDLVDHVNEIIKDSEIQESFRDNILGFTSVLQEGKFKLSTYIAAVKFVSHRLNGDSIIVSYTKAFPDRYARQVQQGVPSKDIASVATSFSKSLLVTKIMEQAIVPTWIVNQELNQRAINTLADLMINAKSEKVRSDSANSLLTHLKQPEKSKIELDVNVKNQDSGAVDELRKATQELVRQQREMLQQGNFNAKDIAHSEILEGEFEEVPQEALRGS